MTQALTLTAAPFGPMRYRWPFYGGASLPDEQPLKDLIALLRCPRPELSEASQTILSQQYLPPWQRLIGERNIQHHHHHYPLDVHTLNVVENTRLSSFFGTLSPEQQDLTLLGALLHDLDKVTGHPRYYGSIPVDRIHPTKSAELSAPLAYALGASVPFRQRLYTLITHHQQFGALFARYPDPDHPPPEAALQHIALKLRGYGLLNCLLSLSEGDIRSVQRPPGYYTESVSMLLPHYGQQVQQRLDTWSNHWAQVNSILKISTSTETLEAYCGFILPAESMASLMSRLTALSQGGGVACPYVTDLGQIPKRSGSSTQVAALVSFIPEHLAYWGPNPQRSMFSPGQSVPMKELYHLWQGALPDQPEAAQQWLTEALTHQRQYSQDMPPWWQWEAASWASSTSTVSNTAPSPPSIPSQTQEWIGLGTRPILLGVVSWGTSALSVPADLRALFNDHPSMALWALGV